MTRSAVRICPAAPKKTFAHSGGSLFSLLRHSNCRPHARSADQNHNESWFAKQTTFGSSNLPSSSRKGFHPFGWKPFFVTPYSNCRPHARSADQKFQLKYACKAFSTILFSDFCCAAADKAMRLCSSGEMRTLKLPLYAFSGCSPF